MAEETEGDKQEKELEEKEKLEGGENKGEAKGEQDEVDEEQGEAQEKEEVEEGEEVSFPDADELNTSKMLTNGLRILLISILLTSVLYVLATTGIGTLAWRQASQGDLVKLNGEIVGSKLIGQSFSSDKYFHPRPSSKNYDAMDSGSANLAPTNDRITKRVKAILNELEQEGVKPEQVPVSFVTESGSALDPHIVPESAYLQVPRVSKATGIEPEKLGELVKNLTRGKFLGLYGQKRVNVLKLNMKIEKIMESG